MKQIIHAEREYALIIQQTPDAPEVAATYLRLMLNYLYGLEALAAAMKMLRDEKITLEEYSDMMNNGLIGKNYPFK